MIKIAPSILSADFCRLGDEIRSIEHSGAEYVHFDVMDGVFVPNISVGVPVLKSVREITGLQLDVHLMISEVEKFIPVFCENGADIVTFHYEAVPEEKVRPLLAEIRKRGKKAGLSIKPGTSASVLENVADLADLILVMTVEPGFGGQSFICEMLPKIAEAREIIGRLNPSCELEVDGGINSETGKLCIENGAEVLVAGSYFFSSENRAETVKLLKGSI